MKYVVIKTRVVIQSEVVESNNINQIALLINKTDPTKSQEDLIQTISPVKPTSICGNGYEFQIIPIEGLGTVGKSQEEAWNSSY